MYIARDARTRQTRCTSGSSSLFRHAALHILFILGLANNASTAPITLDFDDLTPGQEVTVYNGITFSGDTPVTVYAEGGYASSPNAILNGPTAMGAIWVYFNLDEDLPWFFEVTGGDNAGNDLDSFTVEAYAYAIPGSSAVIVASEDSGLFGGNTPQPSDGSYGDYYTVSLSLSPEDWPIPDYAEGIAYVKITPTSPSGYGLTFDDITYDTTPIPIPGAVWLLGSGLIGIVTLRKKLKQS